MSTVLTLGDLSNRLHRMVKGSRRESFNVLGTTVNTTDVSIVFTKPTDGITEGTYLGIGTEIMYVYSVAGGNTATVRRGMFNTLAAAHTVGDLIEVDWRWFTADVIDALADDIRSWPEDVFKVSSADVSVGAGTAFDLPLTGYRSTLKIRRSIPGGERWVDEPSNLYRVATGLPTSSFASGNALYLPNTRAGSGTVRIDYAADFITATLDIATLIADIGLPSTLIDAALYGGAWRLLVDREAQRSAVESQPEPRQATDVKEGASANVGSYYKRLRDTRLAEEARRLRGHYPYKFG